MIDSTFATPLNLRPLDYGVDLVVHSVTKYLAGHNDLMAGGCDRVFHELTPLRQMQALFGQIVAPHTAYLILRGIKTLALRVDRHNANGLAVARFLADQPKGTQSLVSWVGLSSRPRVGQGHHERVWRRG